MRFQAEHRFEASPARVADVLTDPEFYRELALPDVSRPEVVDSSSTGPEHTLRLRYEFVGSLDSMARRLLGPSRLAWVQDVRVDAATHAGHLSFQAQADPKRLFGTAQFTLDAQAEHCIRHLAGELVVAVPVIGPRAEKKIVPGVLRRLDIEAQAVNEVLSRRHT